MEGGIQEAGEEEDADRKTSLGGCHRGGQNPFGVSSVLFPNLNSIEKSRARSRQFCVQLRLEE